MTNKHIYLAGGCFWGTEHFFKQIAGVVETEVGFANGQTDKPTYEQVYTDTTGYAETVHVTYDPDKVSLEFLLHMFFVAIDPTSLNKQGHDEGTRYRTGIYYTNEALTSLAKQVPDIGNYQDDNGIIDFSKDMNEQLYILFNISREEQSYIKSVLLEKEHRQ